eukprot:jgi/Chlat1/7599/Chrsp64S07154
MVRAQRSQLAVTAPIEWESLQLSYWKNDACWNLESLLTHTIQHDATAESSGLMLFITTFASTANDGQTLTAPCPITKDVSLAMIGSEKLLRDELTSLYNDESTYPALMLIRCERVEDYKHIHLTRLIVTEQHRAASKAPLERKRHICLLVHLAREAQHAPVWRSHMYYGWHLAFVDSVQPKEVLRYNLYSPSHTFAQQQMLILVCQLNIAYMQATTGRKRHVSIPATIQPAVDFGNRAEVFDVELYLLALQLGGRRGGYQAC